MLQNTQALAVRPGSEVPASMITPADLAVIRSRYAKRLALTNPWERVGYASQQSQMSRFHAVMDLPEYTGRPFDEAWLLDVGCGTGDFFAFLNEQAAIRMYTGVDILEEMVDEARARFPQKQFPNSKFFRLDILTDELIEHDYVVTMGALTPKVGNNGDYFTAMVDKMLDIAVIAVAMNFLMDTANPQKPDYHYYNLQNVLDHIKRRYGRKVEPIVKTDYHPFDATLFLLK